MWSITCWPMGKSPDWLEYKSEHVRFCYRLFTFVCVAPVSIYAALRFPALLGYPASAISGLLIAAQIVDMGD